MAARAGAASGVAGFATFIVVHSVWIFPIWFIAPTGAVIATAVGAAVGMAFDSVRPMPWPTWSSIGIPFLGVVAVLVPAVILSEMGLRAGAASPLPIVAGHVGSAAAMGGLLGAVAGRTRRSVGMCAFAAVLIAVGPGHNIPMLASTPGAMKELTLLLAVFFVAAVALGAGNRLVVRRTARAQSARSGAGASASIR